MTAIPTTDVIGQRIIAFPTTTQPWSWAKITINRTGTGGTHPWFNSLVSTDTLQVLFEYSLDGGQSWRGLGTDTLTGGSHIVKGVSVPVTNEIGVGIGTLFPSGTQFRVTLTASTPLTFDGSATYGQIPLAPTLIAVSEVDSGATQIVIGAGLTSATLTWQTGDVLIAIALQGGNINGESFNAPTNTGSGLSWVQKQLHAAASDTTAGLWMAQATASSSGTVTITRTSPSGADNMAICVYQARGGSVGNTKLTTGATTSPQQGAVTMTAAHSLVCWGAADWSAGTVEASSPTSTSHSSASPGPSASPTATLISGQYSFYFAELDDEASSGSVNFGFSGSSSGPFTIVAAEVIDATPVVYYPYININDTSMKARY